MKIEKLSDKQIRCTLSREDLVDRELRISELAYGTEKAKALFHDMMQQASYEFGFEADDIPLMVEAIPVSAECLILLITKVDDPDELDTRFSKFSSSEENDSEDEEEDEDENDEDDMFSDEITSNLYEKLREIENTTATSEDSDFISISKNETGNESTNNQEPAEAKTVSVATNLIKVYSFSSLDEVTQLARIIGSLYNGENSLFKDQVYSTYYLIISKSSHTAEDFNKVCNVISEYGKIERSTYASQYYYEEHYELIIKNNAIQVLYHL